MDDGGGSDDRDDGSWNEAEKRSRTAGSCSYGLSTIGTAPAHLNGTPGKRRRSRGRASLSEDRPASDVIILGFAIQTFVFAYFILVLRF